MLRPTYSILSALLLLAACGFVADYPSISLPQSRTVVADGPTPDPPPYPLAQPGRLLAEG